MSIEFKVGDFVIYTHPFNGRWYGIVREVKQAALPKHGLTFGYSDVRIEFEDSEEWLTDNNDRLRHMTDDERIVFMMPRRDAVNTAL